VDVAVTLKDIAAQAGVHLSTVSRVLNHKRPLQRISERTRLKIIEIANELNYQPNEMARSLRLKRTFTIGLILPDISNSFFSRMARSIEIEAEKNGYTVIICNSAEVPEKEHQLIELLIQKCIDGLIITPVQQTPEQFEMLRQKNFPFVFMINHYENLKTNAIITDNHGDAFKATQYLIQTEHRRIGCIHGRPDLIFNRERLAGYRDALQAYQFPENPHFQQECDFSVSGGCQGALAILSQPTPPTALLITDNLLTIGALKAIHQLKLHVPNDISIIGFCDDPAVDVFNPPITTISHPLDEIGQRAFTLLNQTMQNKNNQEVTKIVLNTKFHLRESTTLWEF
jgi:LacI family transcriptional regulator